MEIKASDPDIDTIYNRIDNHDWNLQPEFQRGEVWSTAKKQRLIDTILRGWHVPPIHLIQEPASMAEVVLDGQQRLTAIRDFRNGTITVNGNFSPIDPTISSLHGRRYQDLPDTVKRAFNRQSIRVLTVTNFQPEEPGELFFRLNQPTNLTTAEQRNAFFGPVRSQIKALVQRFEENEIDERFLGFSNSRMAYDDIIARVANTLQYQSLKTKITASSVSEMYRLHSGLPSEIVLLLGDAIDTLGKVRAALHAGFLHADVRFNKATLHSWLLLLIFARRDLKSAEELTLSKFVGDFEIARMAVKPGSGGLSQIRLAQMELPAENFRTKHLAELLVLFNDRAASRVADVGSVILRDAVLWLFAVHFDAEPPLMESKLQAAKRLYVKFASLTDSCSTEEALALAIEDLDWGASL